MFCECCQKQEATIHVTQVVNDKSRELHLCQSCAESNGLKVQDMMSLPEVLFGMGGQGEEASDGGRSCPRCHMRAGDFRKTGRLGCSHCYESFSEELEPMLAAMHKGTRHCGKVPRGERARHDNTTRLDDLRKQLAAAVKKENFEEAARLRDLIGKSGHDAG